MGGRSSASGGEDGNFPRQARHDDGVVRRDSYAMAQPRRHGACLAKSGICSNGLYRGTRKVLIATNS